jgi:hypothetical protein
VLFTVRPVHRLALNLAYDITNTNGHVDWLRADNGQPLQVLGDAFGNSPGIPGNPGTVVTGTTTSTGTIPFLGPFPNQPLGSLNLTWQRLSTGFGVDVSKGLTFKALYGYYDYTEGSVSANQLVVLPRNFHTNMGTLSLKYSF